MKLTTEKILVSDVDQWKKQLITKEDPGHLHKTLGLACLASFVVRLALVGPSDMGFLSHPHWTLPTLALHFMLTASAFQFKIPLLRIKDGTRIWPEYRMHAMVFLCRALATIGMYWYEDTHGLKRHYEMNLVIVLASMAAADLCSASVGSKYQSNSVRDMDTHPAAKYFFSTLQFYATAGFLMGFKRYSLPFLSIMVVQLTPFLGTLRRKNLMSARLGAFLYGVFLAGSYVICAVSPGATFVQMRITGCFAAAAALWRMMPMPLSSTSWRGVCQNKYLIWTCIGLAMRQLRPLFDVWTAKEVNAAFGIGALGILMLGYWKMSNEYSVSTWNVKATTTQKEKSI